MHVVEAKQKYNILAFTLSARDAVNQAFFLIGIFLERNMITSQPLFKDVYMLLQYWVNKEEISVKFKRRQKCYWQNGHLDHIYAIQIISSVIPIYNENYNKYL